MKTKSTPKTKTKIVPPPASAIKAAAPAIAAPVVAKKKKSAAPAPTVKAGKPAVVVTVINAQIDIGFGNTLYLRGEGPGLSWDHGIPLDCVEDDRWTITLPGDAQPVIFKFLVNDLTWSVGPDYVAMPGSNVTLVPVF